MHVREEFQQQRVGFLGFFLLNPMASANNLSATASKGYVAM